MRYFTYLASQAFQTGPDATRLFYRSGPWSRPYIVPNERVEERLFRKQLWLMRVLIGTLVLGQPLLFFFVPEVVDRPLWFLSYVVLLTATHWFVSEVVLWPELRNLARRPKPLPMKSLYESMAEKHTEKQLKLGLIMSIVFVVSGLAMLALGENPASAGLCVLIFGPCTAAWGYALKLKRTQAMG